MAEQTPDSPGLRSRVAELERQVEQLREACHHALVDIRAGVASGEPEPVTLRKKLEVALADTEAKEKHHASSG